MTNSDKLQLINEKVKECDRCKELTTYRTQTVFGDGSPEARVVFLGEAPGKDEDVQGVPFVGKAGQLLNNIITACGLKREDVYICNILRCRPPNNRTPLPEETENCRPFLDLQLKVVNPEYIVCLGACAAQNLLATKTPISQMRRQWFQYGGAKVLCTFHPAYLLRNPHAKKDMWDDMQLLLKEMNGN